MGLGEAEGRHCEEQKNLSPLIPIDANESQLC